MKLNLGDQVLIKAKLKRVSEISNYTSYLNYRTWRSLSLEPVYGIWIGYRTLSNGVVRSDGEYDKRETFEANLVVTHPGKVPFFVLDADLESKEHVR